MNLSRKLECWKQLAFSKLSVAAASAAPRVLLLYHKILITLTTDDDVLYNLFFPPMLSMLGLSQTDSDSQLVCHWSVTPFSVLVVIGYFVNWRDHKMFRKSHLHLICKSSYIWSFGKNKFKCDYRVLNDLQRCQYEDNYYPASPPVLTCVPQVSARLIQLPPHKLAQTPCSYHRSPFVRPTFSLRFLIHQ